SGPETSLRFPDARDRPRAAHRAAPECPMPSIAASSPFPPPYLPSAFSLTISIARMRPEELLCPEPQGLCCRPAGVHIDPVRPVDRALITLGRSDHARAGHGHVMATPETLRIMALRYGENFAGSVQPIEYGEIVTLKGGVQVSFHPAGHVL